MSRFYQCFLLLFGLTFSWLIPTAHAEKDAPNTVHYEEDIYFYHTDHLGGTRYLTDKNGDVVESILTFPGGEPWVNQTIRRSSEDYKTPYTFTGKEQDASGLYYYGARYYDPRAQIWASVDPILNEYLGNDPSKLPGMGGIFNSRNLGMYSYSHNNPVVMKDPDGNAAVCLAGPWAVVACAIVGISTSLTAVDTYNAYQKEGLLGAGKTLAIDGAITLATGGTIKIAAKLYQRADKSLHITVKLSEKAKQAASKIAGNREIGDAADQAVTAGLRSRFKDSKVGNQVRGYFDDGSYTVFDNVVVDKKGKIQLINETKAGGAQLSDAQKRFFEGGEAVTFKGSSSTKAGELGILGQRVSKTDVPTQVERVSYEILE